MGKRDIVRPLVERVSELERAFQQAAFDAARDADDYELSEALLGVARDMRALGRRVSGLDEDAQPQVSVGSSLPRQPRGRRTSGGYPRFIIEDDRIVKIGKGKKRGAEEYRHEAPADSFSRLVAWMDAQTASGNTEWDAQDAVDALKSEVPSYQTYLMIAALLKSELLEMVKRGTYRATSRDITASEYWGTLRAQLTDSAMGDKS